MCAAAGSQRAWNRRTQSLIVLAVGAGSADKTVRLWSLDAGMPLATSRSHSGTVRALALDEHLLVSASNLARPRPPPHMLGRHARGV